MKPKINLVKARHCGCRSPSLGSPMWGSEALVLREYLQDCGIFPSCGSQHWECEPCPDCVSAPPIHLNVAFLFIFSCGIFFLLVIRSFSEIVSLCEVVILVCPWEVASPPPLPTPPSCSTLLLPSLKFYVQSISQMWA